LVWTPNSWQVWCLSREDREVFAVVLDKNEKAPLHWGAQRGLAKMEVLELFERHFDPRNCSGERLHGGGGSLGLKEGDGF
jgi:hypothetical protein